MIGVAKGTGVRCGDHPQGTGRLKRKAASIVAMTPRTIDRINGGDASRGECLQPKCAPALSQRIADALSKPQRCCDNLHYVNSTKANDSSVMITTHIAA